MSQIYLSKSGSSTAPTSNRWRFQSMDCTTNHPPLQMKMWKWPLLTIEEDQGDEAVTSCKQCQFAKCYPRIQSAPNWLDPCTCDIDFLHMNAEAINLIDSSSPLGRKDSWCYFWSFGGGGVTFWLHDFKAGVSRVVHNISGNQFVCSLQSEGHVRFWIGSSVAKMRAMAE